MFNKKMTYIIKSVPLDDKNALETLLNQMSDDGWDLYSMHEAEADNDIYNLDCIFVREKKEEDSEKYDDIVDVTTFKHRMEKMLSPSSISPYDSCKDIQLKISAQKEKIKTIKAQLESESLSLKDKKKINDQMSDELKQLDVLKQALVEETSPNKMYSFIKEDKFVVQLSDELFELIEMNSSNNLFSQTVKVRQDLTERLGYVIPQINFQNSDELSQYEFRILLHDVEVYRDIVFPDFVAYFKDEIKGYEKTEDDYVLDDIITGRNIIWIPQEKANNIWTKGYSAIEYIARAIEYIAIKEVAEIMDYNDINKYVEIVMQNNSFLVDNIIPDYITAADLKYLLTNLVREEVSIKNIIYLFEKINDYANEPSKEDLYDKLRLALAKQIIKDLSKDDELEVYEFSETNLDKLALIFNNDNEENVVKIDSAQVESIADDILKIMKNKKIQKIILAVPIEIRHMVFIILSEFIPNITILALEELSVNSNVRFVGEI